MGNKGRHPITTEHFIQWELFRAAMRQRRIRLGLTQHEVAERMGRSSDFVTVLENNNRSIPTIPTVWLWVDALDGSLDLMWQDGGT